MGLLNEKKVAIFGLANDRSIAWGIAEAMHKQGARLAFSYAGEVLEKRVRPLAESVNADLVVSCDVTDDAQIAAAFDKIRETWGTVDVVVHSIAFAQREDLEGRFLETSRAGFSLAMDVSAYSLVAIARAAAPLMPEGGSILTLSYYGSQKVVPGYNVMGVAKAALEASVRYLAADLGPQNIRVNAISAGPIKTLAFAGIKGSKSMLHVVEEKAPLRRNVTQEEVGKAALFLCSELGSGVTGEITYVDAGYNAIGM